MRVTAESKIERRNVVELYEDKGLETDVKGTVKGDGRSTLTQEPV